MHQGTRHRKGAWGAAVVVVLLVALLAGLVGGYLLALRFAPGTPPENDSAAAASESDTLYTCGMHPQILQREPGLCPICHMQLTPVKHDAADDEEAKGAPEERKVLYWRSPMHPDFISDRPGKDFMGHDLVPVYSDEGETISGQVVRIDPVTVQNMGIRTTRVRRGPLVRTVRTVGRVDYDEQELVYVDMKFEGWIEQLHVDETGQSVRAGDPLFEVYSPDLYAAQVEYISALRKLPTLERSTFPEAAEDARRLIDAARLKLEFYDVPPDQIERIRQTMTPEKTLQIRSPADGIVAEKMAIEGMRVMPGMRLYTIADLSRVWAYVDIYEYQLPWVRVGQPATMTLPYIPDRVFRGEVTYIYPYVQKETRVIKVRLEFENPELELKPDMYANVTLEGLLHEDALLVPREAYIDSGLRQVSFVDRGKGKFEPRDIQVGVEGEGGMVEVLLGLQEGDVVVTSGQFLLDSESKFREAIAKMMEPQRTAPRQTKPTTPPSEGDAHQDHVTTDTAGGIPADARYACPMDRHPDETDPTQRGPYFSAEPGQCPVCGMGLKPLEELDWVQVLREAGGGEVGYTCPTHQHVFSHFPGACPVDGHALEPFKVLYTCRNPEHSRETAGAPADCPLCGEPMAAYRGPWLGADMVALNPPQTPGDAAKPAAEAAAEAGKQVPADAQYACPMQECWQFSEAPGRCPACGMKLKPIEEVEWAARLVERAPPTAARYVCPMHPDRATSDKPGTCPICAMQLVPPERIVALGDGLVSIPDQVNYLLEHYLGLQEQLAGDSTTQVARHALGMADASETLRDYLRRQGATEREQAWASAVADLHTAALRIRGVDLASDRAAFAAISTAMRTVIAHHRPDTARWPRLYIYHCPMSQADWIQPVEKKANPYYGFKMLDCGNLVETK